jgi:hypothetical protein
MDRKGLNDLNSLCRIAGDRADGHGSLARVLDAGEGTTPPGGQTRKILLAAALAAGAAAVLAARLLAPPSPHAGAAPGATDDAAGEAWLSLPASHAAPEGPIRWQGQRIAVDIDREPLGQAIDELARATNSSVSGQQARRDGGLLTMHWTAGDAATAWQLLLRDRAAFSLRCGLAACQVRITGPLASSNGDAGPPSTSAGNHAAPAEAASPDRDSQPDGAC